MLHKSVHYVAYISIYESIFKAYHVASLKPFQFG
jgi:hypothetical protein